MGVRTEPTGAERAASEWIVRLNCEDASADDHRRFQEWLRADPQHETAYAAVGRTWRRLGHVRSPPPLVAQRGAPAWRAPAAALAIAASALLAFTLFGPKEGGSPADAIAYTTQSGEQRSVALPDGSTMILDSGTTARVDFSARERRIDLQSGAALFDVRASSEQPFVVRTALGDITVLGTSFVVHVGASGVRTTVLRGVVQGETRERGVLAYFGVDKSGDVVTARANQEIYFGASELEVTGIPEQVVARRLAWRERMLAFDGETLGDAAAEVTRHTGVAFEFSDPEVAEMRIGGYISAESDEDFVALLESGLSIRAERVRPDRVLLTRELRQAH
jgi:transmembrane sensor